MHPTLIAIKRSVTLWQRKIGLWSAPAILLGMRLLTGICFYNTGHGKLANLEMTTEFFTELKIPFPQFNAVMAGSTELFCGLLLAAGLMGRLASLPLIGTMVVALLTAHLEATKGIFSDPNEFIGQAPIPFLMTALVVLAFGPGRLSIDGLIEWRCSRRHGECSPAEAKPAAA